MRLLRCALVGCLALVLVGCGGGSGDAKKDKDKAQASKKEPTNQEKLVGMWEVTKSADTPPGALLEFTKDGKMKMKVKIQDKEIAAEGTYSVDGDKINTVGPKGEKETAKIKKLTDTELTIEDEKGKLEEYKKK
jgi:uncharacterized protein (TIGR03066 family)